jgi:hypothetical protein
MKKMLNKAIIRTAAMIIGILLFPKIASSQIDWRAELKEDIVEVVNGKYKAEEFTLIKIADDNFQIKMSATGSVDVMSRDNFVSIYHSYGTILLLGMFDAAGISISSIELKTLDELIGEPDITLNFIMAKSGIQIQIITDEGVERITFTWEEVYQ